MTGRHLILALLALLLVACGAAPVAEAPVPSAAPTPDAAASMAGAAAPTPALSQVRLVVFDEPA